MSQFFTTCFASPRPSENRKHCMTSCGPPRRGRGPVGFVATAVLLLSATASTAFGQSKLFTFEGDSIGDQLGTSVSGAGDVNADGFADLIVGTRFDDNNGAQSGSARVFSGVDGSLLYPNLNFDGDAAGDQFGTSVSGAGDVNGDGFADFMVGAPLAFDSSGVQTGLVRVFSGIDGSTLFTFFGVNGGDKFGTSVSDVGDMNGDGLADFIVGAPFARILNGAVGGTACIFSGLDGSPIWCRAGGPDYQLGSSVSGAGDLNVDGVPDVIVGAPFFTNGNGAAWAFSGVNGASLLVFFGASGSQFGTSVSGAGDVNADAFADVIVGAPFESNSNGVKSGRAHVYSGFNGALIHTFEGDSANDRFGFSVGGAGDVNADGFSDLLVGAPLDDHNGPSSGSVRLFSGVDGSVYTTFEGDSANGLFGASVSGAGDVNGDTVPDLIVGAPEDDNNGVNSGSAHVIAILPAIGTNYCGPAVVNSTGKGGMISATGSAVTADNNVFLWASSLPTERFGMFLVSKTQGLILNPGGSQGNLCLRGNIGRLKPILNSGPGGTFILQIDLTQIPPGQQVVMSGQTWNFTAWFRDVNPNTTSNFTDGLTITFL